MERSMKLMIVALFLALLAGGLAGIAYEKQTTEARENRKLHVQPTVGQIIEATQCSGEVIIKGDSVWVVSILGQNIASHYPMPYMKNPKLTRGIALD